jgi:hypothetical protein
VFDRGEHICLGLGLIAGDDRCSPPPVEPRASVIDVRRVPGATLVAGVVPADVATVRIGSTHLPTTAELPEYQGQYRGQVRFFSARLDGSPDALRAVLLSASGEQLGEVATTAFFRNDNVPVTVRRAPQRIARTSHNHVDCLVAAVLAEELAFPPCAPLDDRFAIAITTCAPRATVLYAPATIRARLRDGRRLRSARLARRLHALRIPSSARLRTVAVGRRGSRATYPPAARQCGYADVIGLR